MIQSNQKEMPLPNVTNYLFWHNRQDCCFSLSSIFISSSLLSDQCWWRYIKGLEFQWNCHYKGFQGSAHVLWVQCKTGESSCLSHIPCSPDFPVIRALCLPSHPGYLPEYLVFVSGTQWVASYFVVSWKGQQPVSSYELIIKLYIHIYVYIHIHICFNHL